MSELAAMREILEDVLKNLKAKMSGSFDEKSKDSEHMPENCESEIEVKVEPEMGDDDPMAEIEADQKEYFKNDKPREEKKGALRGGFLGGLMSSASSGSPFKKRGK